MKAQLFINPAAGRWTGKKLAPMIRNYLHKKSLISKATFSLGSDDLIEQVKRACLEGCETVLIAGGDGSIYAAVNGIMRAEEIKQGRIEHASSVELGIIPIGTGNDFIKAANISPDWRQACEQLLKASPQLIDVAQISTKSKRAQYFLNNIGSGFDAGIGITAAKIPLLRGKAVYVVALIWHLLKGIANPVVKVRTENCDLQTKTTLVAVSNGTSYGGSFKIAPQASINDGLLDAVIAPPVARLGAIPLIIQLMRGSHLKNPKVTHLQCEEFHLSSNIPIPVIADGEVIDEACTEYHIKILKRKLILLV